MNAPKIETVNLVKASDITPEPVDWLWDGWLAAGKMHILGGSPGTGKTTIGLSLAATLSSGGTWPDGSQAEAKDVVIWTGEDDPKDTLVPRLMAAGADCNRVHFIGGVRQGDDIRMFDPAEDIEPLHRTLTEVGNVRLVIIDPIVSAIHGDSHKNADVRRGLEPLVGLAESLRCALVGVTHFSKNTSGGDPVERLTGSLAFGAQARVVWVVAKREHEDGSADHVICRAKSNIGPDSGGFKYEMNQSALTDYPDIFASTIQWGDAIEGTAREILAADANESTEDRSALQTAKDFLIVALSDGAVSAAQLFADAESHHISERTLKRAKADLGVTAKKVGNAWVWRLPLKQEGQPDSSVPTETVAPLASLPESPVDDGVEASVPRGPTKEVEPLKTEPAPGLGKMLSQLVAEGRKELGE
jgi:putative DNA primase/helicase